MVWTLLEKLAHAIDSFNEWIGRAVAWLTTALVLLFCADVFMRYLLQYSSPAIFELEWHLFAVLFLFGAGYTLKHDKHVRVDVFYARWSEKQKAWINLVGVLLFLLPFCLVVIQAGIPYVKNAWLMNERSSDPGGLPARYLIKSTMIVGFGFLWLQGLSLLCRSLLVIAHKSTKLNSPSR